MKSGHATQRTILAALLIVISVTLVLLRLLRLDDLTSAAAPAAGYEAALARFREVQAEEHSRVTAPCRSRLLDHGLKTRRAYVLIHGITNSPAQWAELGQVLHQQGHNVLILRMPYHGLVRHHVSALSRLTPQDLCAYADRAVDIAGGLGDEVIVAGSSGGAAVAAWAAQNRPKINQMLLLAPFFGVHNVPPALSPLLANVFSHLPNFLLQSEAEPGRDWVYSGQATRGVAAFLMLGQVVFRQARAGQAPGGTVAVLTTAVDDTASNTATAVLVDRWRRNGCAVQVVDFPAEDGIPHNAIDPSADPAKKAEVYAAILRLLGKQG